MTLNLIERSRQTRLHSQISWTLTGLRILLYFLIPCFHLLPSLFLFTALWLALPSLFSLFNSGRLITYCFFDVLYALFVSFGSSGPSLLPIEYELCGPWQIRIGHVDDTLPPKFLIQKAHFEVTCQKWRMKRSNVTVLVQLLVLDHMPLISFT